MALITEIKSFFYTGRLYGIAPASGSQFRRSSFTMDAYTELRNGKSMGLLREKIKSVSSVLPNNVPSGCYTASTGMGYWVVLVEFGRS